MFSGNYPVLGVMDSERVAFKARLLSELYNCSLKIKKVFNTAKVSFQT